MDIEPGQPLKLFKRSLIAVAISLSLAACGGGGGGGGTDDSDGDGVADAFDAFPNDRRESADFDGDGIGDNADNDDDNDGTRDVDDAFPFDNTEQSDNDGDDIGDNADLDDDNDGTPDVTDDLPFDPTETVDTDGDGTGNNADLDDDNDRTNDVDDAFPLDPSESRDTDGDGIGNNADPDDDNDDVLDDDDQFPTDPTESSDNDRDGIGDNADPDDDNDGVPDVDDDLPFNGNDSVDTDGDGIGNTVDQDDDNDGVNDGNDAFPLDPSETTDSDGDGLGNNTDTDDDNDGVPDVDDDLPTNPNETLDTDGDGIGNNTDSDDDGDGVGDVNDDLPLDPTETTDSDGDGVGNNADADDDNDGVEDSEDAFPTNPNETLDTDGDGIGNNTDSDDDGDGIGDANDDFPLDPNETTDTDGDGIGNNADLDDDNDGVLDEEDACPTSEGFVNSDDDQFCNAVDVDDDNDGVNDPNDAFPLDPNETVDTDGDGIGNNADPDDDNDGIEDSLDACPLAEGFIDTDGDTICDAVDQDDDNDGVGDANDDFDTDPTETTDSDGDGIGNNADTDDDNDGVADEDDAFPTNPNETLDTDGDGIGNNTDSDDDEDGVGDANDDFPLDPTETLDTDGDGLGNNADPDDDNDGIEDALDDCPLAQGFVDTDEDGICNAVDNDDDGDGVNDPVDDLPLDPSDSVDTDGDGIGDSTDTDDDGDGTDDVDDAFPLDPTEDTDTDGDNRGDNSDIDVDGNGLIEISSLEEFDWIRNNLGGTALENNLGETTNIGCDGDIACNGYELTADLDFDTNADGILDANDTFFDYEGDGSNRGWLPIGGAAQFFTGNFNGNGHTISNLFINRPDQDDVGLFASIASTSPTKFIGNFTLDGPLASVTGNSEVGALAGRLSVTAGSAQFADIVSTVSVKSDLDRAGGFVGILNIVDPAITEFTNILIEADISPNFAIEQTEAVGGVIGRFQASGDIEIDGITYEGSVIGGGSVGGFVGELLPGTASESAKRVRNVVTLANVTGLDGGTGGFAGEILGSADSSITVETVVFIGSVNLAVPSAEASEQARQGGFIGILESDEFSDFAFKNILSTGLVTGRVGGALVGQLATAPNGGVISFENILAGSPTDIFDDLNPDTVTGSAGFIAGEFIPAAGGDSVVFTNAVGRSTTAVNDAFGTATGAVTTEVNIERGSLEALVCSQASNDPLCLIEYAGWDDPANVNSIGEIVWDFGTNTQLPGLNVNGVIYRDSDGDGLLDEGDEFPEDPSEELDSDGDGIGNNEDDDDDNDGVLDVDDAFPLDPTESVDTDLDGIGNNADEDDDNDGTPDINDDCPLVVGAVDFDMDGLCEVEDLDDDNDGVLDEDDAFDNDPTESSDMDGDGIGDNADTDDDNDSVEDTVDIDVDGDGLIEIETLEELDWMRNNLQGTSLIDNDLVENAQGCADGCFGYELTASLDFDTNADGLMDINDTYFDYDGDGSNQGWLPIGSVATPFAASFDANGNTISNLFINRAATDDVGLFGVVEYSASSEAVNSIVNITFDGDLATITGGQNVGVVTGSLVSTDTIQVNVQNITSTVAITAENGNAGGVIGQVDSVNTQQLVLVELNVSADLASLTDPANGDVMGGIVGSVALTDSALAASLWEYQGSVTGGSSVAGLIGEVTADSSDARVEDSYGTGAVAGDSGAIGGIVGALLTTGDGSFVGRNLAFFGDIGLSVTPANGATSVGGFIGSAVAQDTSSMDFDDLLATGSIATSTAGGQFGTLRTTTADNLVTIDATLSVFDFTDATLAAGFFAGISDPAGGQATVVPVGVTSSLVNGIARIGTQTGSITDQTLELRAFEVTALQEPTGVEQDGVLVTYQDFDLGLNLDGLPAWDFGTSSELPGLLLDGEVIRDADGDGVLD